jgi:hypothetical protein
VIFLVLGNLVVMVKSCRLVDLECMLVDAFLVKDDMLDVHSQEGQPKTSSPHLELGGLVLAPRQSQVSD